jgi:hypothetical protein
VTLRVYTFGRVPGSPRVAIVAEGEALLRFMAPGANPLDVRFSPMRSP